MALSGSFSKFPTTYLGLYCTWSASQSIANNNSVVTIKVYVRHKQISVGSRSDSTVTCNNSTQTYTSPSISSSSSATVDTLIGTKSFTVGHNSDGTKSTTLSASWRFGGTYSGVSIGTITASTNITLDTIPRQSAISSVTSSVSMTGSNACSVSITRYSSSFTHKVVWSLGSYSYTASNVGTSTSYTIPADWINAVPNSVKGTAKVTVTTYNGSTPVGNSVSRNFEVTVPEGVKPYISNIVWTKSSSEPSTWPMTQGISYGTMTMSGVSTAYSSPIASYSLTFAGLSSASTSLSVPNISKSGTLSAVATVVDKRGRTYTRTVSFSVTEYTVPQFSTLQVYRCDSSGSEDDNGDYMYVKATVGVTSVSDNALQTLKVAYKIRSNSSYTTVSLVSGIAKILSASSNYTWDWVVTAQDKVKTATVNGSMATGDVILDISADGNSISFGKVSEKTNAIEFASSKTLYTGNLQGMLKATGGTLGTATAGTDYVAPSYFTNSNSTDLTLLNGCKPLGWWNQIMKRGNLCIIALAFTTTKELGTNVPICNLPTGYQAYGFYSLRDLAHLGVIQVNGSIVKTSGVLAAGEHQVCIPYFCSI